MQEPTDIQLEIARQVAHMKPAHLRPGTDVVFLPIDDDSLAVWVRTDNTKALVTYDAGRDTYVLARQRVTDETAQMFDDVYCDQLGELIFGSDAKGWTMPFGEIYTDDGNGGWTKVAEF